MAQTAMVISVACTKDRAEQRVSWSESRPDLRWARLQLRQFFRCVIAVSPHYLRYQDKTLAPSFVLASLAGSQHRDAATPVVSAVTSASGEISCAQRPIGRIQPRRSVPCFGLASDVGSSRRRKADLGIHGHGHYSRYGPSFEGSGYVRWSRGEGGAIVCVDGQGRAGWMEEGVYRLVGGLRYSLLESSYSHISGVSITKDSKLQALQEKTPPPHSKQLSQYTHQTQPLPRQWPATPQQQPAAQPAPRPPPAPRNPA